MAATKRSEWVNVPHDTTVANEHRVSTKQWSKWSPHARYVFNDVYSSMRDSPWAFAYGCSPKNVPPPRRWRVTCWNAAWIAADAVDEHTRVTRAAA